MIALVVRLCQSTGVLACVKQTILKVLSAMSTNHPRVVTCNIATLKRKKDFHGKHVKVRYMSYIENLLNKDYIENH